MSSPILGVIGCGNMAGAIVRGIHAKNPEQKFLTYTPSFTRAAELAQDVGGKSVRSLAELAPAESLIIGCKPQQFSDLSSELKDALEVSDKHIISIMAAVSVASIQKKLGSKSVTRVMPNTPALFNQGVSLVFHAKAVTAAEQKLVESSFSACSQVFPVESEKQFDQVTTVSGSGPAYVFYFAKTMTDQLEKWGVNPEAAKAIVIQLFRGSTELMAMKPDLSLEELIAQVTSKGGVTIEAVKSYKAQGLDLLTEEALAAAYKRSEELTKELS